MDNDKLLKAIFELFKNEKECLLIHKMDMKEIFDIYLA